MILNIALYASLRERVGKSHISMEISDPATGAKLLDELFIQYPSIKPLAAVILISINQEYADRHQCYSNKIP